MTPIGSLLGQAERVTYNAVTAKNITTISTIAEEAGHDFKLLQKSLDLLAYVVIDNRLALDYLLAQGDGVCATNRTNCYSKQHG